MPRLLHLSLIGLLVGLFLMPFGALADKASATRKDDAEFLMQAGVAAFDRGDLEQARELLEAARARGLKSPSLRYNLGVLYYRIERYDLSQKAFQGLLSGRHDALARYNLGLVARARGRPLEARHWFQQVLETTEEQKLRQLAQIQLEEQPSSPLPVSEPWLRFVSLGAGYENNLALRPESVATGLSDSFSEVVLAGQGAILALGQGERSAQALHVSGSLFRRQFHSEDAFTSDAGELGLAWVSRGVEARREAGLRQSYFQLGGEPREMHTSLLLKYRRNNCRSFSHNGRCDLSLIVSRVRAFDGFEGYGGMRYLARAGYRHDWKHWRASARLSLEFNAREDIAEEDQFFSVSPRRQESILKLDYRGWRSWTLGGELAYRYSDYPDPYRLSGNTEGESGRRVDHLFGVELAAEYALTAAWSVSVAAGYRNNDSSLNQYRYDNHVYQVSIDSLF
ncbi:tetratricopeptide repeat protein [uncultured Marinobacter sp.]|uniref:tetratricopeptide repeat protein n=1 Tax=uncultured Marinobacter sp. TaxID=187379 RepID=UPI0030DC8AB7